MYAVIEIGGKQFKIAENQKIFVPKLSSEIGAKVKFDKVLLYANDNETKVGAPTLTDIMVEATVLDHAKDDKVIVFKKKRRKGYKVRRGHRQAYTQVEINKIGVEGESGEANTRNLSVENKTSVSDTIDYQTETGA